MGLLKNRSRKEPSVRGEVRGFYTFCVRFSARLCERSIVEEGMDSAPMGLSNKHLEMASSVPDKMHGFNTIGVRVCGRLREK